MRLNFAEMSTWIWYCLKASVMNSTRWYVCKNVSYTYGYETKSKRIANRLDC